MPSSAVTESARPGLVRASPASLAARRTLGRSALGRTNDPEDHRAWRTLSRLYNGRQLTIVELLGGLDDDDERRRAGPRLPQDMLNLIGAPLQLLRSRNRQDDLAGQRLEVAFIVGRRGLDENLTTADHRRRRVSKLPLQRATAGNLNDESRLACHLASLPPPSSTR